MPESIDWPIKTQPARPRRRAIIILIAVVAVIVFGARTTLSYWVDLLWFNSLGYGEVFWKTCGLQWGVFAGFFAATFVILYGAFLALKRAHSADLPSGHTILIAGREVNLPVEPVLRIIGVVISFLIAVATGGAMQAQWPTLALYWYGPHTAGSALDPIFGRPLWFYLFTLPLGSSLWVGCSRWPFWFASLPFCSCSSQEGRARSAGVSAVVFRFPGAGSQSRLDSCC